MNRTKEIEVVAAIVTAERSRPGRKRAAEKVAEEILGALDALYAPPVEISDAERFELAKVCSHPTRVKILTFLAEIPEELAEGEFAGLSPSALAAKLGQPLGQVSYHVRGLSAKGMVELLHTEPRRGALEHYYGISDLGRQALILVAPRRSLAAA